jgi:hypothetical protein
MGGGRKKEREARHRCLILVNLTTWVAEIRRIIV